MNKYGETTITEASTQEQNCSIQNLENEAAVAGDLAQVALCRKALWGNGASREAARVKCLKVISDSEAQQ